MFDYLPEKAATTAVYFAVLSLIFCLAQIFLRQKVNFMPVCKVSVYVPILSIFINILIGIAQAADTTATAGSLPHPVQFAGLARMLSGLSFGILATIILATFYAITATICEHKKF